MIPERGIDDTTNPRKRMFYMAQMLSNGEQLTDEHKQELLDIYNENPRKLPHPLLMYVQGLLDTV